MVLAAVGSTAAVDVTSCSELQQVNNDLGADYELRNDIDCSSYPFDMIGESQAFTGRIDGNGYSIQDLDLSGENSLALFWRIGSGGEVGNITFENFDVYVQDGSYGTSSAKNGENGQNAAGLALTNNGLVENVGFDTMSKIRAGNGGNGFSTSGGSGGTGGQGGLAAGVVIDNQNSLVRVQFNGTVRSGDGGSGGNGVDGGSGSQAGMAAGIARSNNGFMANTTFSGSVRSGKSGDGGDGYTETGANGGQGADGRSAAGIVYQNAGTILRTSVVDATVKAGRAGHGGDGADDPSGRDDDKDAGYAGNAGDGRHASGIAFVNNNVIRKSRVSETTIRGGNGGNGGDGGNTDDGDQDIGSGRAEEGGQGGDAAGVVFTNRLDITDTYSNATVRGGNGGDGGHGGDISDDGADLSNDNRGGDGGDGGDATGFSARNMNNGEIDRSYTVSELNSGSGGAGGYGGSTLSCTYCGADDGDSGSSGQLHGFVSNSEATEQYSYWLESTASTSDGSAAPTTSSELQEESTFQPEWDFENVWGFGKCVGADIGGTYPVLRGIMSAAECRPDMYNPDPADGGVVGKSPDISVNVRAPASDSVDVDFLLNWSAYSDEEYDLVVDGENRKVQGLGLYDNVTVINGGVLRVGNSNYENSTLYTNHLNIDSSSYIQIWDQGEGSQIQMCGEDRSECDILIGKDHNTDVSSGEATASFNWGGVACMRTYPWYAIADDGAKVSVSDVWSFETLCSDASDPSAYNPEPSDGATNVALDPEVNATYRDPNGDIGEMEFYTGSAGLIGSCNNLVTGEECGVEYSSASDNLASYDWYVRVRSGESDWIRVPETGEWSFRTKPYGDVSNLEFEGYRLDFENGRQEYVVPRGQEQTIVFETKNRKEQRDITLTITEGGSFSSFVDGTDSQTFTLGNETRTSLINVAPDFTGSRTLELEARNNELNTVKKMSTTITSKETVQRPGSANEVPGISIVNLAVLAAASLAYMML
ncbi:hypothetical protein [Candidatus Nanohalococcus occultus]|uniref:Membrane protein n=1 Tax=Candidatus Nanohalococcus occultus TaxID=2978047 RepID=A0ABY8CEL3_9ARCH|nr:putative membrane protein [Candidatus Nanohaloarchaeota archaeon SVXNc]